MRDWRDTQLAVVCTRLLTLGWTRWSIRYRQRSAAPLGLRRSRTPLTGLSVEIVLAPLRRGFSLQAARSCGCLRRELGLAKLAAWRAGGVKAAQALQRPSGPTDSTPGLGHLNRAACCLLRPRASSSPASHPLLTVRRLAPTGFTRSSTTATGSWPGAIRWAFGSSPARATTGRLASRSWSRL